MAMTDVQICNIALARLGSTLRIASLTDGTVQADQCSLVYETLRDQILADFPWTFATRYGALTVKSTEIHPFYAYVYEMPADALRVLRVFAPDAAKTTREPFAVFNYYDAGPPIIDAKRIATDIEDAQAEFIIRITDPTIFTPGFIDALAWRLAAALAFPLKVNAKDIPLLEAEYQRALGRAQTSDANHGVTEAAKSTRYQDARW